MTKTYFSMKDLCERFQCSRRTIYNWMDKEDNPFPSPRIRGSVNKWFAEDVMAWEDSLANVA